jgi:hypothetical protein
MSHHLDTPLASQTGQLYIDDLYVFPGEGSTVFIMDVNSNVNGLFSEPGLHPEARYEFKVHFDGADFEALTYRVSFGEADSGGRQRPRSDAVLGHQHRSPLRAEAIRIQAVAAQQLPLRRAGLITCATPLLSPPPPPVGSPATVAVGRN